MFGRMIAAKRYLAENNANQSIDTWFEGEEKVMATDDENDKLQNE